MNAESDMNAHALALSLDEGQRPSDDFVICRDANGVPTAIYGSERWDLNPIRLRARFESSLSFDSIFNVEDEYTQGLVADVKHLLFCLIFFAKGGAAGRLSGGVISKYYYLLRNAARFCYSQREKPMVGVLSFKQLFTNATYLASFIRCQSEMEIGLTQRKALRALITHMVSFGERRLGYRIRGVFDLEFGADSVHCQHPVIPVRIYLCYLNLFSDSLDHLVRYSTALSEFLIECKDPLFARTHRNQRESYGAEECDMRPTFSEAVAKHGLDGFFKDDFSCDYRHNLSGTVLRIQFYLKMIIHAYTGMRDQEVLRMPYNALRVAAIRDELLGEDGVVIDPPQIIELVSSTTKFSGYEQVVSWLANDEVAQAVKVAQAICRSLCTVYEIDTSEAPLFLNPAILSRKKSKVGVPSWDAEGKPSSIFNIRIRSEDLHQLSISDEGRDFFADERFSLGNPWPLTSHQFRRSLVFYGSSSGFISFASMKRQLKHVSMGMTRYYGNGFEKLTTVFGYYDEVAKGYVLPQSHVAYDFQMAIPISIAYDLLLNVFGESSPLFGGVGSYLSKQRAKVGNEVSVADMRKETQRLVSSGRMSYRPTLLGGCTKVGACDSLMLGDFTACLSCDGAVIKLSNLEAAVLEAEQEIQSYSIDSGEYQVTLADIKKLKNFQRRNGVDEESNDE